MTRIAYDCTAGGKLQEYTRQKRLVDPGWCEFGCKFDKTCGYRKPYETMKNHYITFDLFQSLRAKSHEKAGFERCA